MNPVALAVWLLVLGNLAASLSDVAVKMLQGEVVPFQYMFLRQLFAFASSGRVAKTAQSLTSTE